MTVTNRLPNKDTVMQVGLYETDKNAVRAFADRIAKYNHKYMANITLDVEPHEKGDSAVAGPHFKLRIVFPSHEVQEAFWME